VANIFGFYWKGTNDRRFSSSYIEVSRKNGKALSLDTPIPTPKGWTTMG
jgi:phage terminase large subunit-like protein